jgi:surface polysaccharide O-acyltransferase-like enzyme
MSTSRPTAATSPPGLAFTSLLRIVAIAAVVLIHVFAPIAGNDAIRFSRTWWVGTTLAIGVAWAVPAFVMVSGALLLPSTGESAGAFFRRRLARIGIPLVAAHVGYLVLRVTAMGQSVTADQVVVEIAQARVFTHLYFFWIVLGLYAVTPLLRPFVERLSRRGLLVAGLAAVAWMVAITVVAAALRQLGTGVQTWQPAALVLFVPYLGYFLVGAALRDVVLGPRGLALAAFGAVAGIALTVIEYAYGPESALLGVFLGGNYQGLPVAMATIGIYLVGRTALDRTRWLTDPDVGRRLRWVGELAFGVFLVHYAVIVAVRLTVPALAFGQTHDSVPLSFVEWAIVVVVSFGLSAVMSRIPGVRRLIGLGGGR